MALRTILLRKRLTDAQKRNADLRAALAAFDTREAEIAQAIEEAETEEQRSAVTAEVETFETERRAAAEAVTASDEEVANIQRELDEAEQAQEAALGDYNNNEGGEERNRRRGDEHMNDMDQREIHTFQSRSRCFTTRAARDAFYGRTEVREFLGRVRTMLGNQPASRRAVTGADLTIPTIILDIIRDNLNKYSKLLPYVSLKPVSGRSRQNVIGDIPEGVWMEMTGALNDLTFTINDVEMDGFKVGGIIIIPNSYLEDSDINLGEEILYMLGQSIGMALDKAIVYGKGSGQKMPIGIMTRLAETSQPAYWDANRMPWIDLHSANVVKLNILSETGTTFFSPLLAALAKAKPKKDLGERVWIMNEATRTTLMIKAMAFNSAAALVSQLNDTMPVLGGKIVTLDFMTDNNIVGGYLARYLLAERQGSSFGYSDLPLYIQDKTVFKGTARYDGQPIFGESFVAVTIDNTNVVTEMDFAADYANQGMNALIVTAAAGSAVGKTVLTVSGAVADSPTLKYKASQLPAGINVGDQVTGFSDLTSGTTAITAAAGTPITVVELDSSGRVVSLGYVTSVPQAS